MNDDLESKLMQIADMLNNKEDMPDGLKNIVEMVKGKSDVEASKNDINVESNVKEDDTIKMMMKLKKIMDSSNMKDDPKISLLNSIKPFLRESRQQKVNNCIKFLGLSKATKYMDIIEKNG